MVGKRFSLYLYMNDGVMDGQISNVHFRDSVFGTGLNIIAGTFIFTFFIPKIIKKLKDEEG